jgi:hypothetical protein
MYFPERIETAHYPVQRVNFGTAAQRADLYHLRKEEMYWHVRGLFKDGLVAGLTDEETIQQLAGVRYLEDDKRRMRRSTDYGARRYRAVNARVLPRPRQGRRGQTTRSERGDSSNPY